jgi:mitochondrial fission protein ELM1
VSEICVPSAAALSGKLLILSDGKPGHVNQSIAFARLLDLPYDIRRVSFRNRLYKALSYFFDKMGIYTSDLFDVAGDLPECSVVVSAGSGTYYASRFLSRALGVRSVAIMLPRNYRYDFDLIVAQQHDRPPVRDNILILPANLSFPEPKGLVERRGNGPCVSLIIGGPSRHYEMSVSLVENQVKQLVTLFPDADFLVTTSRRTPAAVEELIDNGPFRYKIIASREQVNPVADLLAISDYVFVTEDSTSMISEAVSFGKANVEVLPLPLLGKTHKVRSMLKVLSELECLHIFDGTLGSCNQKLNQGKELKKVVSVLLQCELA